jgi:serine O-acetyltransferase
MAHIDHRVMYGVAGRTDVTPKAKRVAKRKLSSVLRRQRRLFAIFLGKLREDWHTHDRDWTLPGFRAMAVYRLGVWQDGIQPSLVRRLVKRVYLFLFRYVRNHYGIELVFTTRIGRRMRIGHQGGIVIHPRAVFGNDCLIRQNVTVGAVSGSRVKQAPRLGNRVELGCGCVVLGGVTVGDDTRIGANAVVMTNVPEGSTVVASPPRIIKLSSGQRDQQSRE